MVTYLESGKITVRNDQKADQGLSLKRAHCKGKAAVDRSCSQRKSRNMDLEVIDTEAKNIIAERRKTIEALNG